MPTPDRLSPSPATGVSLQPVVPEDGEAFMEMAESYFRELNRDFAPADDWRLQYFIRIVQNSRLSLNWVMVDGSCAGFILFGAQDHPFLPRTNGIIYELYIQQEFRRQGIASACVRLAIETLLLLEPSKLQLEIATGNSSAARFWASLGFEKAAERWVLNKEKP